MESNWKQTYLNHIAQIQMGQSPPGSTCSNKVVGLPLLNGPTEFGAHHPFPTQYTSDPKKVSIPGDILFCVRGSTTGRMNWSDQVYAIGRGIARLRHINGINYQPYIKAILDYHLPTLLISATGSTFPNVSRPQLEKLEILLPTLPEQRVIAHILGSLDDKIELNRQMNQTLEAMTQAIFKSWFVDFDPVHAKAEGRDTGLPAEIANLFPDSFEPSELGLVPKGWKVMRIGDVAEFAYGNALKASDRKPGNIPVFGSNGIIGSHNEALVSGPGIVVGRKGNPGIVKWSSKDFFPIDTTFYIKPKGPITSLHYLYYALKDQDLPSQSADSAVPGLNRKIAYMNNILVPCQDILIAYNGQIVPIFKKINTNDEESVYLTFLRDTLLPKLISGELRLPAEALEKFSAQAGGAGCGVIY